MTLLEAIEVAKGILTFVEPGDLPDEHDALRLLIEAAKIIEEQRSGRIGKYISLLPEETKE